MPNLAYKQSGVDIDASDQAVSLIKEKAEQTMKYFSGKVLGGIGYFNGMVELADKRVMGATTDGVGTKLVLSVIMDKHDTIGQDLVAMCANDLIAAGLSPQIFFDYLAVGKQIPEKTESIVTGVIKGCEQAECALLGGEMSELPGLYADNLYSLAGFAIGFAENKEKLILGDKIEVGMKVYGFPSSGIHASGYSLVRKVFHIDLNDQISTRKILNTFYTPLNRYLGDELLEPTRIYVKEIKELLKKHDIRGMAPITTGGLLDNPRRILPQGCSIRIDLDSWTVPVIFRFIQEKANIPIMEMLGTFNYGIGMIVVTPDYIEEGLLIGEIISGNGEVVIKQ